MKKLYHISVKYLGTKVGIINTDGKGEHPETIQEENVAKFQNPELASQYILQKFRKEENTSQLAYCIEPFYLESDNPTSPKVIIELETAAKINKHLKFVQNHLGFSINNLEQLIREETNEVMKIKLHPSLEEKHATRREVYQLIQLMEQKIKFS